MITILPCYSLEDFSIYRTSAEANQIFSAWTALYHPALIRHCDAMPSWDRASSPAVGKKNDLILIPPCACGQVPRDWLKRAENTGTIIIKDQETRAGMVAAAFERLGIDSVPDADDDVETFYALGFSYFVSELFSRKLRYMSNLDTQGFRENGLKAARALGEGDREEFLKRIGRAFELLAKAKEYFFPTAMKILDLTVVSRTTLDALPEMLRRRAARDEATNLLIPVWHLRRFRKECPEGVELLRSEIAGGRVTLVGGDLNESPLWLFSPAETARRLMEGWEVYHEYLGVIPTVFGRIEAGYSPILPQILPLAGCKNALLFTEDGWKGCTDAQSRVDWRGPGGGKVASLSRPALDASTGKSFMELPDRIGYSSSGDRVLSAIFKHRPGEEQVWLGDMARMSKFAPVLGEVLSLEEFFRKTADSGVSRNLQKDLFRTNFLTRAARDGRRNPVSVWPLLRCLSSEMDMIAATALFAGLKHPGRSICALPEFETLETVAAPLDELKADLIEQVSYPVRAELEGYEEEEKESAGESIRRAETERLARISAAISEKYRVAAAESALRFARLLVGDPPAGDGFCLLNMTPHPACYETETAFAIDPVTDPLVKERTVPGMRRVTVTVPPLSLLALRKEERPIPPPVAALPVKKPFLARLIGRGRGNDAADSDRMVTFETVRFRDGVTERFYTIRTGYFVMKIDADTGAVRSVRTHMAAKISGRRGILNQPGMGNRIAWQVAMKLSGRFLGADHRDQYSGNHGYSLMAADKIEILSDGPWEAVLRIDGALVAPGGERLARFSQKITVGRLNRVIDVELTFKPDVLPQDAPWDEYYGVRFAWNDNLAELRPACHGFFWETTRDFFQAPDALDIRSEEELGVTILSGGLPFYQRSGARTLDAVLVPHGEGERVFRFGVGIDLADPLAEAARYLAPQPILLENVAFPAPFLIRLLEVSPESTAIAELKPVYEQVAAPADPKRNTDAVDPSNTRLLGFRVLLHETSGRKTSVRLVSRLPIASAVPVDFFDRPQGEPYPLDDAHTLTFPLDAGKILPLRIAVDFDAMPDTPDLRWPIS
ncbi:MAG: hypothetical protein ACOX6D_03070 [Thermoguttaceae bacterium]|jgi:hypothetical protein